MTKKNVLVASTVYFIYALALVAIDATCHESLCRIKENTLPSLVFYVLFPFAVTFLLSLVTYRMKEEVFQAWLKVAYWMVPLIILATLYVQFLPQEHGFFAMDALAYLMVIAPLYTIFVLLSLWKIVRTYLRTKNS